MKTGLIAVLAVLLIASPVYAGMLDNGADQWDSKYYLKDATADKAAKTGPYGSRQIDKDGLDCTPLDVKLAVVGAFVGLVAGLVAAPAIVIGVTAAHTVTTGAVTPAKVIKPPKGKPIKVPAKSAPTVRHSGHNITLSPWVGPAAFVLGMAEAMYLSDYEKHAACMYAKGYSGPPAGKGAGGASPEAAIDHSAVLFGQAAPQS